MVGGINVISDILNQIGSFDFWLRADIADVMAYSEANRDKILGVEKMASGRNAISDILKQLGSFDFWHGKDGRW